MRLVQDQSMYQVGNPRLTDEQIEVVSKELGAILHGDTAAFEDIDIESMNHQPEPGSDQPDESLSSDQGAI